MSKILFIIAFLCYSSGYAKKITDSSSVPAIIKQDDTYLCRFTPNTCHCITGITLDKAEMLVISGAQLCNDEYHNNEAYFTVLYDTTEYLIEANKVIADSTCFRQLLAMSSQQKVTFKENAKFAALSLKYIKIDKAARFVLNAQKQGLILNDWSLIDASEYTQGTGVKFDVRNPTTKTIKYIAFTLVGFNPVGDPVKGKSGINTVSVKCVGPIASMEDAIYSFDYVWLTDMVEDAKITSIKVQYMDNTVKVISNPKLVTITDEQRQLLANKQL